jgi:hypothetical protein
MIKIGFLNENGDCMLCPHKGDLVTVSGEPFIVEEVDGQNLTVIDEEGDYQASDFELDERVLEITESENTQKEVDGFVCLGESEMGEVYVDKDDNCYLLEAKVEMYWPYRSKKGNKVVLTGEKHDDMIEFWDENGKYHEMSVEEFEKQYKKSTAADLDLFESVTNETADLVVNKTAVNGKMVTVHINGKKYSYEPTNGMTAKELAAKYDSIAKHYVGKALVWLKKNAVTKDSHKKEEAKHED